MEYIVLVIFIAFFFIIEHFHSKKIENERVLVDLRTMEFVSAFQKGFEAAAGHKPYELEEKENDVLVLDDETLYEMEQAALRENGEVELSFEDYHQLR